MPKRQRRTTRARRASSDGPRPATRERPASPAPRTRRATGGSQRAGSTARPGAARAIGEPSAILEREAEQERTYVTKDFRRIAFVVAVMVALLVVSDIAVNALLP
ncbi:MAG: hypothetical protein ACYC9W_05520 [Candidatus Limnocylindria bacterium]